MVNIELKYIDKLGCYWFLTDVLFSSNYKILLDDEFRFTYFLNFQLVSNYEFQDVVLKDFKPDILTISNCKTNLLFNTKDLLTNSNDEFLIKSPLTILQTNFLLPGYVDFAEKSKEICLSIFKKNKFDWGIYTELSAYSRVVEVCCENKVVANKLIKKLGNSIEG